MRIYLLREGFALIPTLKGGVFTLRPLHSPEINMLQDIGLTADWDMASSDMDGMNFDKKLLG